MKHGPTLSLILAAALAAAPAMAQSSAPAADKAAATVTPVVPAAAEPAPATTTAAPAAAPAATPPGPLAMTIPTPAPAAPGAGSLMQTTFALLFVLALLVGGAWFLKRFGPRNLGGAGGTVKLVGSLSLGTRERILVVEVGEQWIVVGASPGRMNALATMPRQENSEAAVPAPLQTANFAEWFKQTIDKRNAK
jgi:flagellar protein FliO/FliZ